MTQFVWTGGNTVDVEGVRGQWTPNEPVDVSQFTPTEITALENCTGMEKVPDEPKPKKASQESE